MSARTYRYSFYREGQCVLFDTTKRATPDGKWALWFGIHAGTLVSRDEDTPAYGLDSFAACKTALEREIAHFAKIGYYIWHACAIAPDGTRHKLVDGAPYV